MKSEGREVKNAIWVGAATFFAYAACYGARNVLSAIMPQMINEKVFTHEAFGGMASSFFLTYGIGQLINGLIGNKIKTKYMVTIGLFMSAILVAAFPLCGSVQVSVLLWGFCGFLCSMLWGPISKLVGENTAPHLSRIVMTALSVASIVGTALAYLLAAISFRNGNWKIGFYITGALLAVISVLWYLCNVWMERAAIIKTYKPVQKERPHQNKLKHLFTRGFIFMMIVTMLNGIIRNAVSFWIPAFISDKLKIEIEWVAAVSSVLPVFNLLGSFSSIYLLKFIQHDEKKLCWWFFILATVMFGVLYLIGERLALLSIVTLFIANAAMVAVCNLIFSVYAMRFADTGKLSGISGFLDFTAYMSAAGASIIFAKMSVISWNIVMLAWLVTAFIGMIFAYASYRHDNVVKYIACNAKEPAAQ
ncbi:MAG: MFS transporter [Firmicutes bacterium]|nr:MFS transporter [Bacillota bacterium]